MTYNPEYHRGYYLRNREKIKQRTAERQREKQEDVNRYHREYRLKLRTEVLLHYGGICVCCDEDDIRFLTLDHVNNDGAEHRTLLGNRTSNDVVYRWIAKQIRSGKTPEGFQVLCWNCNCGRAMNGGVCPHKEGQDVST